MNKIFILLGPSGSGKTTLSLELKKRGIPELVSHTTRDPRVGETNGVEYHFVTEREFDNIDFLEESTYAGDGIFRRYGLSKKELDEKLAVYDRVFAILNREGLEAVKQLYAGVADIVVLYCYCGVENLINRMQKRGNALTEIVSRIKYLNENHELENIDIATYVLKTDIHSIEKTTKHLSYIIDELER